MRVNCRGEAVVVTTGCYAVSAGTRFQRLRRAQRLHLQIQIVNDLQNEGGAIVRNVRTLYQPQQRKNQQDR